MEFSPGKPVIAVGECMVEFFRRDDGAWVQGFAGDTLNTLWAMRALLPSSRETGFFTRVGTDGFSDAMLGFLDRNGIGTGLITRDDDRQVGLYTIETDERGERAFSYWRSVSAARQLGDDRDALAPLGEAALVYLSGITLAILGEKGRENLLASLGPRGERPVVCAFDPNIRPALWESESAMRHWVMRAAAVCDIVLPTFDDEAAPFGDAAPEATLERYRREGVELVAVKNGVEATLLGTPEGETLLPVETVQTPVDTTGAGDSFGGGFLAALLLGKSPEEAVHVAQRVSGRVVCERGALVAPEILKGAAGL